MMNVLLFQLTPTSSMCCRVTRRCSRSRIASCTTLTSPTTSKYWRKTVKSSMTWRYWLRYWVPSRRYKSWWTARVSVTTTPGWRRSLTCLRATAASQSRCKSEWKRMSGFWQLKLMQFANTKALFTEEGTISNILYPIWPRYISRWIWCLSLLDIARTLHEISALNCVNNCRSLWFS